MLIDILLEFGRPLPPPSPPKLSAREEARRQEPGYEPDDQVEMHLGVISRKPKPASLVLRINIPPASLPPSIDQTSITAEGLYAKIHLQADNIASVDIRNLRPFFSNVNDKLVPIESVDSLPYIVRNTRNFGKEDKVTDLKRSLYKLSLSVDNSERTINSEHIMNNLKFEQGYQRAIDILRKLLDQDKFDIILYIENSTYVDIGKALDVAFSRMRLDLPHGNIYHQFHCQDFHFTRDTSHVDFHELKWPEDRPAMTVSRQISFRSNFEMLTLNAVAVKERMEYNHRKALKENATLTVAKILDGDARFIDSLGICMQGGRKISIGSTTKVVPSNSIKNWTEFTRMQDARSHGVQNLLCSEIATEYLSNLKDADQLAAVQYLSNAPLTAQKRCLAAITGFAGSGKTTLISQIVTALFLQQPKSRVLIVTPSNEALDVMVAKMNETMQHAKTNPKYESLLDHMTILRDHKALIRSADCSCIVIASTVNTLGHPSIRKTLSSVDTVIIDEANQVNIVEWLHIVASVDYRNCIVVGDPKQLGPQDPNIQPKGCTALLTQSILGHLIHNHWPAAKLTLNRRAAPGMSQFIRDLFYRGMSDAPCTKNANAHPKTASISEFFKVLFPEYEPVIPFIFIEVPGAHDTADGSSYFNLSVASVVVSIIELGIKAHVFLPEDVPQITHYSSAQKVYTNAFAKLHKEFPSYGFDRIRNYTTHSIQAQDATCPFVDPVRTQELGFTNDRGRNAVLLSRARDFAVVVAKTYDMRRWEGGAPYILETFELARKKGVAVHVGTDLRGRTRNTHFLNHRYVEYP